MLEVINREKGRSFTINDLAQLLDMSYAKTYNTFQALLEDIDALSHGERVSHTVAKINGTDLGIPLDCYASSYSNVPLSSRSLTTPFNRPGQT